MPGLLPNLVDLAPLLGLGDDLRIVQQRTVGESESAQTEPAPGRVVFSCRVLRAEELHQGPRVLHPVFPATGRQAVHPRPAQGPVLFRRDRRNRRHPVHLRVLSVRSSPLELIVRGRRIPPIVHVFQVVLVEDAVDLPAAGDVIAHLPRGERRRGDDAVALNPIREPLQDGLGPAILVIGKRGVEVIVE